MTITESKTLKVPFQQRTKSGCGSHSLANLLNNERILEGVEDLVRGEGVADLNKKLESLGIDLYLDVVFASPSELKDQPNKLIDKLVFQVQWDKISDNYKNNYARPFLLTIKGIRFHCILVLHNFRNDLYYVVDSLKDEVQVMFLDALMNYYHITSVEYVCSWKIEDEDRSIFMRKDYLTHIIPEGE